MSKKTFNYRVLSRDGEVGVYEVYYDEDGKPVISTTDPLVAFTLPTVEDLRYELEAMLRALDEPVLQFDEVNALPAAVAIDKIGEHRP
jgi:hypothetical protein